MSAARPAAGAKCAYHGSARPGTEALEVLLSTIADRAASVQDLLAEAGDATDHISQAVRTMVGVIGWLADSGLRVHCSGHAGVRGDAAQWLLHGDEVVGLQVPGGAA